MERIAANLRRTGLPNFCARDLAMPRRAPYFPHLLPNLITDHKPFVSRECVETAIDALVNGGRLGLRFEKLTSLVRFFLAFFLLLIMRPDTWTYEASTPSWKPVQGHPQRLPVLLFDRDGSGFF